MCKVILLVMLAITVLSCMPHRDDEAQRTLQKYVTFIDSIYGTNENWKMTSDTEYVELLINPEDLVKTKIDTIVTPASSKKSMMNDAIYKVRIFEQYIPLKVAVDLKYGELDSASQHLYTKARKKFELLLVE